MKRAEVVKEAELNGTKIVWPSRCPSCSGKLVEAGDDRHCFPCNASWSKPRSGFKPQPVARHKNQKALKRASEV